MDKHNASKMEILGEILAEIASQQEKYKNHSEALSALDAVEDLVIWWCNTPTVWLEKSPRNKTEKR